MRSNASTMRCYYTLLYFMRCNFDMQFSFSIFSAKSFFISGSTNMATFQLSRTVNLVSYENSAVTVIATFFCMFNFVNGFIPPWNKTKMHHTLYVARQTIANFWSLWLDCATFDFFKKSHPLIFLFSFN